MTTLTITVDPDVLRRARLRALERNESVNQYLAEMLERYADTGQENVVSRLFELADKHRSASGTKKRGWNREDLYDAI